MKKCFVLSACLIAAGVFSLDTAWAGQGQQHRVRQQQRIRQGVANDELTGKEVRKLQREQMQIQRHREKALEDGTLTPQERNRLQNLQNKADKHIYDLKHNKKRTE